MDEKSVKDEKKKEPTFKPGVVICKPTVISSCCGTKYAPPPPFDALPYNPEEELTKVDVKQLYIVYNPFSGNGKGEREWKKAENVLRNAGIKYTILQTKYAKHATQLAAETPLDGYDGFVVIGGDGTFNEFITGLFQRKDGKLLPLGLIAGGTGNSVLTTLGLLDTEQVARNIVKGELRRIDLGRVTVNYRHHYMINCLGWGVVVDANTRAESCRCCGPMRYNFGGCIEVCKGKERTFRMELDGGNVVEGPHSIMMIQNNQHAGNKLRFTPFAMLNDGLLDLLIVGDQSRCNMFSMFEELKRDGASVYYPAVEYRRFQKMKFSSNAPHFTIDGESLVGESVDVEVLPRILPIFHPHPQLPHPSPHKT